MKLVAPAPVNALSQVASHTCTAVAVAAINCCWITYRLPGNESMAHGSSVCQVLDVAFIGFYVKGKTIRTTGFSANEDTIFRKSHVK